MQPPAAEQQGEQAGARKRGRDEGVDDTPAISDSPALLALADDQRVLDDLLARRQRELHTALAGGGERRKRQLRITVFNSHANQPQSAQRDPREPPSWTLKVHGRLLDAPGTNAAAVAAAAAAAAAASGGGAAGGAAAAAAAAAKAAAAGSATAAGAAPRLALTTFLRRLEVTFDEAVVPGPAGTVVWEKARHGPIAKDMFEIKHTGSTPCSAKVKLHMDWQPQQYSLPQPLAQALGMFYNTRVHVMQAVKLYVERNKLEDPRKLGWVRLPRDLAELLAPEELQQLEQQEGQQQPQPPQPSQQEGQPARPKVSRTPILTLAALLERAACCLQPLPPVELTHDIQLSGPDRATNVLDVDVVEMAPLSPLAFEAAEPKSGAASDAARPTEQELRRLREMVEGGEVEAAKEGIAARVRAFQEAKRRRNLLLGFAQDATGFMNGVVAKQACELRVSAGAPSTASLQVQLQAAAKAQELPGASSLPLLQRELINANTTALYAREYTTLRRSQLFLLPWSDDAAAHVVQKQNEAKLHQLQQQLAQQQQKNQQAAQAAAEARGLAG